MRPENTVDLGVIEVHKRVIADICTAAIADIEGVSMARNAPLENLCGIFGVRKNSAAGSRTRS